MKLLTMVGCDLIGSMPEGPGAALSQWSLKGFSKPVRTNMDIQRLAFKENSIRFIG